jgi:hypothetical protein
MKVPVEAKLFPGEGRGPVGGRALVGVARCNFDLRDWAPAFAGEVRMVKVTA